MGLSEGGREGRKTSFNWCKEQPENTCSSGGSADHSSTSYKVVRGQEKPLFDLFFLKPNINKNKKYYDNKKLTNVLKRY